MYSLHIVITQDRDVETTHYGKSDGSRCPRVSFYYRSLSPNDIAQTSTKSIPDYYEAQYSFDVDGQQYLNDSISTMPAPTAFAVAEAPIVAVVFIVQRVS